MKGFIKTFFVLFLLAGTLPSAWSQEKEELEAQRRKVIQEIEKTDQFLKSAQKQKSSTLSDLKALNKQEQNRKELINTVEKEIEKANNYIKENQLIKDSIDNRYRLLNRQYLDVLRFSYFEELSNRKISFLLSSESLNTFILRYRYIKQFESFRISKKKELESMKQQLRLANEALLVENEEKSKLLAMEKDQISKLASEKTLKKSLLDDLNKKETALRTELAKKKKERESLNQEIEKVILAQLKKRDEGDISISTDFQKQKGKLSWPISGGLVTTRFGKQAHPTLKGITIESNGIDISTKETKQVFCVFNGVVVGVTKLIGSGSMVIVNHGNFYTVYSNLASVTVHKGDNVSTRAVLGTIVPSESGEGELHFEIWQNKVKVDPQQWLK